VVSALFTPVNYWSSSGAHLCIANCQNAKTFSPDSEGAW
jgi:hypothetical protein